MATRKSRRAFTLVELLVVIAIIGLLIALLLPAIAAVMETTRQRACSANIRQLGQALTNFSTANDGRYPTLTNSSSKLTETSPGDTGEYNEDLEGFEGAGFSWIVQILGQLDEGALSDSVRERSVRYTRSAFDENIYVIEQGSGEQKQVPIYSKTFSFLVCPSFGGDEIVGGNLDTPYTSLGEDVGLTNYVAMTSTDFGHMDTSATSTSSSQEKPDYKGIIVPKCARVRQDSDSSTGVLCTEKGTKSSQIRDGLPQTILLCESKEQDVASWYDGTVAWVVGMKEGTEVTRSEEEGSEGLLLVEGYVASDPESPGHAVNYGPEFDGDEEHYFMSSGGDAQMQFERPWGPSSDHSGEAVWHVFADAHAAIIRPEINPNVYLHLITKSGGENVDAP